LNEENPQLIVRNYSHEYNSNFSKKSLTIELGEVQKVEPIYTHSHLMNTNRGDHMTIEIDVKIKKEKDAFEVNQLLPLGDFDHPEFPSIHSISHNYVVEELVRPDFSHIPENKRCKQDIEKIINKISLKKESSQKFFANDIELYYYKIFGFVEKHLNEEKKSEFEELKFFVLDSIYGIPPKFPTVKFIPINQEMLKIIESEWEIFEGRARNIQPEFCFKNNDIPITVSLVIAKIQSPTAIGCILGLVLGMSGLRDVLFSSNHYITNAVSSISLITKSVVPFLYIVVGISMTSIKSIDYMHTYISKKYIILSFILRFVILPGIGIIYVWLWKTFYGGIIASSAVVRITLFFPFCLPCKSTIVVIVNIVKYFAEETGLVLFTHNTSIVITLTLLYLIYYVVIGG
jgi:hypothetical protein